MMIIYYQVLLSIEDHQDQPPRFPFSQYDTVVREDRPVGHVITTITASDKDANPKVRMSYSNEKKNVIDHSLSLS